MRYRHAVCLWLFVAMFMATGPAAAATREEQRIDVGGFALNSVLLPARGSKLPPVVFIHGASTGLLDPMLSFRDELEGQATLLFIDRPGHGRSDIGGRENILPDGQADAIAILMRKRGITKAIIVGHSYGGAVTAAFALRHPQMVAGLLFLSPAAYPWEGGIEWYYDAARVPFTGWLFSSFIAPPVGLLTIGKASASVFAPNRMPADYVAKTRAWQALRPLAFHHNAREIGALNGWARTNAARYREITSPTIIITGDTDKIVYPDVHSRSLARDIRGSELIVVHNLGHKSDYVARDLAVAAIRKLAGQKQNLSRIRTELEQRIARDGKME